MVDIAKSGIAIFFDRFLFLWCLGSFSTHSSGRPFFMSLKGQRFGDKKAKMKKQFEYIYFQLK